MRSAPHIFSNLTFTAILSGRYDFFSILLMSIIDEGKLCFKSPILIGFSFKNNYAAEINTAL